MTRKMMLKILRTEGHTCEEAHDGQVAVEKVTQKLAATDEPFYEAILMDFGKCRNIRLMIHSSVSRGPLPVYLYVFLDEILLYFMHI